MSNDLEDLGQTMRLEWQKLVGVAASLVTEDVTAAAASLSYTSHVGKASIERKLRAVQWAISEGMAPAVIIEMGQEAIVSAFNQQKKADQLEEQVWWKMKMAGSLRDALEDERARITKLLHFTNSEQFSTWLHAQLSATSDEEILHAAGEIPSPPRAK